MADEKRKKAEKSDDEESPRRKRACEKSGAEKPAKKAAAKKAPRKKTGEKRHKAKGGPAKKEAPKKPGRNRRRSSSGPARATCASRRARRASSPTRCADCTSTSARALLQFSPRGAAQDIRKLIESAASNAENNHDLVADEMRVAEITVDEGPTLRRFRPRALGRATPINKRTSHIAVALSPEGQDEMGQKIHPGGFRVGYIHDWKSNWFDEKGFADLLAEDLAIRGHIDGKLSHAGLPTSRSSAAARSPSTSTPPARAS